MTERKLNKNDKQMQNETRRKPFETIGVAQVPGSGIRNRQNKKETDKFYDTDEVSTFVILSNHEKSNENADFVTDGLRSTLTNESQDLTVHKIPYLKTA